MKCRRMQGVVVGGRVVFVILEQRQILSPSPGALLPAGKDHLPVSSVTENQGPRTFFIAAFIVK